MGSVSELSLQLESRNGVARIAIDGELDLASASTLGASIAEAERGGPSTIVLDFNNVSFIDCSGLDVLLRAWEDAAANGHNLLLFGADRAARRLFQLTGTGFLMEQAHVGETLARSFGGEHGLPAAPRSSGRFARG
jgi:anti-anti-sigma factor